MSNRFTSTFTALAVAASAIVMGAPIQSASAQGLHPNSNLSQGSSGYYVHLPTEVRERPGTIRILRSRCDVAYPMDETMPCGTATGGPVGGRGS